MDLLSYLCSSIPIIEISYFLSSPQENIENCDSNVIQFEIMQTKFKCFICNEMVDIKTIYGYVGKGFSQANLFFSHQTQSFFLS